MDDRIQRYIKVGANGTEYPVVDVYPYVYNSGEGKQVIRIIVESTTISYDELTLLLANNEKTIYEYWGVADGDGIYVKTLKAEHERYFKDYKVSFNTDKDFPSCYIVELTRLSELEVKVEETTAAIEDANMALCSIYEYSI